MEEVLNSTVFGLCLVEVLIKTHGGKKEWNFPNSGTHIYGGETIFFLGKSESTWLCLFFVSSRKTVELWET